ncbi:ORF6/7 protein [Human adenovirus 53]|uniref:ORF6/7 protein n=2 Tax=Human mastadenovirus D TaxID=130310 RepID=A0A1Y1BWN3_9ADEN|nr:E4 control protein orf6/7 [Human mastadenovirus D]BAX64498.1 ORF6/7 protein [Human adenovirus 53]BAX64726.1 ORF6/7 protein [Human adenovirus 53]
MSTKEQSTLLRHYPYRRSRLPRYDKETRASLTEQHPVLPDCDHADYHNTVTLDCEAHLDDFSKDGFISITDPRLARQETVWIINPKSSSRTNENFPLFKATRAERIVYTVKWAGGGRMCTRAGVKINKDT